MENTAPTRLRERQHAAEPARRPRLMLFVSLGLNVALILFLALRWRSAESFTTNETTSKMAREIESAPKRVTAPPSPWKRLESSDQTIYAANLRAAGCPEKTVRDILLPVLEEKYSGAGRSVDQTTNVWVSFSERKAAATAQAEQERIVREQKDKAARALFGFAWSSDGLQQAYSSEAAAAVGFLDYERAEKLICIAVPFNKQFARPENSRRTDRRTKIYQAWRAVASEVLSAADFEEVELRAMLMTYQRRNPNLCSAGLTGSELRQLMAYRCELCNPLPSALLADVDGLVEEPDFGREQQFKAKARSLLGDNRFLDYVKSCDVIIEKSVAALENEHLPKDVALQIFDLRQQAVAQSQEIRELPVRRVEKRARLAAVRQSAFEQLTALSNSGVDSPLVRINMEWLQEIKNP